ncbi:MAG TPA: CBS domain-containing protein [Salinimicrobium sp.]|nr:CBS domain-containing protein [Salinimicrobium sp.]
MSIRSYITDIPQIIGTGTRIGDLQEFFTENSYSHIPVEKDHIYQGSLPGEDVDSYDSEKRVEDYLYALENFYVRDDDNWLEVLDIFSKNDANILPVLDENNSYLGNVELSDFIKIFVHAPFLNLSGAILIVEKGYKDYSFSEISQIIESNGTHILGAFISSLEKDVAQITIKIGQSGLNTILQSFRRYGYNIISTHQEDAFQSSLRERSDYLDKYLKV